MWQQGNQKIISVKDFNEEVKQLTGTLNDLTARITLAKFLRYNLGFMVFLFTKIKLEPIQELILKAMLYRDNGIIVAGRGSSKCVDFNSLVFTENGFKKIKEASIGEKVFSQEGFNTILAKTENPEEDGFKITTNGGFTNTGKIGHKVLCYNDKTAEFEYRLIENIKENDYIPIKYLPGKWFNDDIFEGYNWDKKYHGNVKTNLAPKNENDFYYLLGLTVGDGLINKNTHSIVSADEYIINFVENKLKQYLPDATIKSVQKKNNKASAINAGSKKWVDFLEFIGIEKVYSHQKKFPTKILRCKKEFIAEFLKGLFDTDGYVTLKVNKVKNAQLCRIGYSSSSYELIKQVQLVLLNFGIQSSLRLSHKSGLYKFTNGKTYQTNNGYSLDINGFDNLTIFHKEIGFRLSRKQDQLEKFLNEYQHEVDYNNNFIPNLGIYLKQKYQGKTFRHVGFKIHKNVSVNRLKFILDKNILDKEDTEKALKLINMKGFINKVKTIEPVKTKTIDIQVENEECYWCEGFVNHNSFLLSVFALLYPIFHFNSKLCIISANFRRSRAILEECDKWINNKENFLLKQCFPDSLRKGNDIFRLKIPAPANSEVFALPLTSGSGGDGLRGTRASCVCVDEGLLITKDIQELVIRPFLTAKQDFSQESMIRAREDELIAAGIITEMDRVSFPKNKYHILSSASYKFEYLYELYQSIIENIENPPAVKDEKDRPSYFAIRMSYEAIPKDSFMDYTQIEAAKNSIGENSEYFKREYKALFSDASDSYFNVKKLQDCTIKVGNFPTTQIVGDKNSSYILTIDPSYSASKSSDFFAMGVYLVNFDERKITLVHTYGRAGGELKDHYDYFTFLLTQFNIIFCAIDASGTEFISGYNESVIAKDKNIKLGFIDANLDEEEPRAYIDEIKKAKNQYNQSSKMFIYAQKFHSMSIRHMNESLHNQISAEKVWFGSKCQANKQAFERYIEVKLPFKYTDKNGEKIDDNSATAEMIYEQDEWIDETKAQLGLIEVKATSQGTLQYDLPQELRRDKSVNRARRDNYTCLLMANWAAKIYFDMFFTKLEAKKTEMFAPTLI